MENVARSTENLIAWLDDQTHPLGDSFEHPLHELLGLDKELRSIRGSLKGGNSKKVQLDREGKHKLSEIQVNLE